MTRRRAIVVVLLAALLAPAAAAGKTDRRALPRPHPIIWVCAESAVPPHDPVLASCFRDAP